MHKVSHLMHATNLGALAIENEIQALELVGCKAYFQDKKRVIKGIPATAVKQKDGGYRYWQFAKQSTHLRQGIDRYQIIRETVKYLRQNYDKGNVGSTGRVTPFRFTISGDISA